MSIEKIAAREIAELMEESRQKDAEIERLNTVIGILEAAAKRDVAFITELADALDGMKPISSSSPVISEMEKEKLIQRAREVTR